MKINKKDIKKWTEALRSGKYEQTQHKLQDANGFCCLGLGCKVFMPTKQQKRKEGFLTGMNVDNEDQPKAPQWLKEVNNDFFLKTGLSLVQLNDKGDSNHTSIAYFQPLKFNEIADVLEAVYIHKVLE